MLANIKIKIYAIIILLKLKKKQLLEKIISCINKKLNTISYSFIGI